MTVFDRAITYLFENESGRYTNNPSDPGGPTRWGVTQKAYSAFLRRPVSEEEIAGLSSEDVKLFYQSAYWTPLWCEKMADAQIAIAIFDTAVLYGVVTCTVMVQGALVLGKAAVTVDGVLGGKTLAHLNLPGARAPFIENFRRYVLLRIDKVIEEKPSLEVFRKGWTARADKLLTLRIDDALGVRSNP